MEQNAKENGVEFVDLLGLKRVIEADHVFRVLPCVPHGVHMAQIIRW